METNWCSCFTAFLRSTWQIRCRSWHFHCLRTIFPAKFSLSLSIVSQSKVFNSNCFRRRVLNTRRCFCVIQSLSQLWVFSEAWLLASLFDRGNLRKRQKHIKWIKSPINHVYNVLLLSSMCWAQKMKEAFTWATEKGWEMKENFPRKFLLHCVYFCYLRWISFPPSREARDFTLAEIKHNGNDEFSHILIFRVFCFSAFANKSSRSLLTDCSAWFKDLFHKGLFLCQDF